LNNDGIAVDARCVGSLSTISSITKKFDKKDNPDDLVTNIDNPTDEEKSLHMFYGFSYLSEYNGKMFKEDSNYIEDMQRLVHTTGIDAYKFGKKSNGDDVDSSYHCCLASRYVRSSSMSSDYNIRSVLEDGGDTKRNQILLFVSSYGGNGIGYTKAFGLRPVFLLDSNVKLKGTGENLGSESNPYRLTK
ncbi:MAG: hypothetical protein J6N78_03315, partial [Clostridia bacterium]|nr:hypothetical protein [Clostridia bacterium]